jgi:nuclear RNA export factor
VKITHASARYQRLFTGTALVQSAWQKLPPTRHLDLVSQFDKYIIDCHPLHSLVDPSGNSPQGVDGMIITMHSEFEDLDPDTKATAHRSFSRTFVLGPGAPGKNPIRVVSDMLSLKAHNPLPAMVGPAQPDSSTVPTEEAQKQQMILELCKQTNMTPEYSKMCLEVASWSFDQALVSFNEKKVGWRIDRDP